MQHGVWIDGILISFPINLLNILKDQRIFEVSQLVGEIGIYWVPW